MSLQRICYLCGGPVSIRRRMSLFCSDRCESRHRFVSRAPEARPSQVGPRDSADPPRLPEGPLGGLPRGGTRAPFRY